jgi:hypothetical protein
MSIFDLRCRGDGRRRSTVEQIPKALLAFVLTCAGVEASASEVEGLLRQGSSTGRSSFPWDAHSTPGCHTAPEPPAWRYDLARSMTEA